MVGVYLVFILESSRDMRPVFCLFTIYAVKIYISAISYSGRDDGTEGRHLFIFGIMVVGGFAKSVKGLLCLNPRAEHGTVVRNIEGRYHAVCIIGKRPVL